MQTKFLSQICSSSAARLMLLAILTLTRNMIYSLRLSLRFIYLGALMNDLELPNQFLKNWYDFETCKPTTQKKLKMQVVSRKDENPAKQLQVDVR